MKKNYVNKSLYYNLYIERLSLFNVITHLLPLLLKNNKLNCYYIDITNEALKTISFLKHFFKFRCEELKFKLIDLRDGPNSDSYRYQVPSIDLFKVRQMISNSNLYQSFCHKKYNTHRFPEYLLQAISNKHMIDDWRAPYKAIMIIKIVNWHMKKHNILRSVLVLRLRPYIDVIIQYAQEQKFSINIKSNHAWLPYILKLKNEIKRFPWLILLVKKIIFFYRTKQWVSNAWYRENKSVTQSFVASVGRGHFHFENDGLNTDAFFCFQSKLNPRKIIFPLTASLPQEVLEKLFSKGFQPINVYYAYNANLPVFIGPKQLYVRKSFPSIINNKKSFPEIFSARCCMNEYNYRYSFWREFFTNNAVKVYLSWYRYDEDHIAIGDAIQETGGIMAMWQLALDVLPSIGMSIFTDVYFAFSTWGKNIENQMGSKISYYVATGFTKDYVAPMLRSLALQKRKELQSHGAEKIITVYCENSCSDERWNYGHDLQRQNYYFILEEVLKKPWLGVIFKPKAPQTLRKRLGDINMLLEEAEKTGRCYVYEDVSVNGCASPSAIPPILAALSADIVIHPHLSAGTCGFESALEGIPAVMIDREGYKSSPLYQLGIGNVVFPDWPSCLAAIFEDWNSTNKNPYFGYWSPLLNDLDNFRDRRAAERMGNYIHWMLEGFDHGFDRDTVLANTAERYCKKWGYDKIVSIP